MGDVKMCIETIRRNWRSLPCGKPAKYGDYCGIHSPEKKAERAKARGPTRWEVDCANRKAEADELATLRAELEEARFHKDAAENQVAMLCEKIDAEQVVFDDMKARAEKAEAAIDAVLNLYPNLENYIDSARRDAKGEG